MTPLQYPIVPPFSGSHNCWGSSQFLLQAGMAVMASLVMLVGGCTRSRSGTGISPENQKAVSTALTLLLGRTNEFRFVIFEERSSRKFVQFAASGSVGLQLDLPSQPLNADELDRAKKMFAGLGVAFETWQLLDQPGGIPLRPQSGFQLALSNDVARATALVVRIFREIYGFPSDLDLVIAEN